MEKIFRWFDRERKMAYEGLAKLIENTHYDKAIINKIDEVVDEQGQVKGQCVERASQYQDESVQKKK